MWWIHLAQIFYKWGNEPSISIQDVNLLAIWTSLYVSDIIPPQVVGL